MTKIVDPGVYNTPRSVTCEHCGLYCRKPTERHHIVSRGMGGGHRLDVPENLIDLGSVWDCSCHARAQAGLITRSALQSLVAKRLGITVQTLRIRVNKKLRGGGKPMAQTCIECGKRTYAVRRNADGHYRHVKCRKVCG